MARTAQKMKIKQILSHLNKERGCVICGFQNAAGDVQGNFQDVEQAWSGVDIEKRKNIESKPFHHFAFVHEEHVIMISTTT